MRAIAVHFLGSGDAFYSGGRHQAGYFVRSSEDSLLMDCGASTLASLKRDKISPESIDTILISHLHGDHFSGLPFLFLEFTYASPRRRPMRIAGPPGTEDRVGSLFRAMYRESGSQPLPFPLEFIEMEPDRAVRIGSAVVDPFRVPHQETDISLGLGVSIEGRNILYSGDTGWTEELIRRSERTDLFICECSFFESRIPTHLDYPRIAENRTRFGTNRLILTHLGEEVLSRSEEVEIPTARDGLVINI
jgi:ribonuclease BN (tRNA processing enzyme)